MNVELLNYTKDGEKLIAAAAKLCYSETGVMNIMEGLSDESVENFVNKLMDLGHESPIEHVSFTFGVEGVSRTLSHQLVRHRIASFSQQSQRYVRLDNFAYIIPPSIEEDQKLRSMFIEAMEQDKLMYQRISGLLKEKKEAEYIRRGFSESKARQMAEKEAIEDARYVFPNACETKLVFTMNARTLFNFFRLRCCERAQWEIREMATRMLALVKGVYPTLFKNCGPSCVSGACSEGAMTCGKAKEIREKFRNL